ncbi:MAG TPA: single-stranded-DNA-specific exonuclease RecJ [Pelagibacteraceae bacterium]|jgi:single-stranded-DNA-specific exonuclease|nr:single-stranded-DNA-specific exonuclease RecJ [Pelagibacteraceae bacterium]
MSFTSVSGKNWIFKKFNSSDIKEYSEDYSLNEIVAKLLSIRKKNIEDISLFLNPTIKNLLPNPLRLKDMENAVERTYQSIKKRELIGVFGDYDVDGATSTALLTRYFLSINQKIQIYIPDRKKEGYGPSVEGFNNLIKLGTKIIFTVDCGTSSFVPIKIAQNQNIDVIVLDHHQSDLKLPNACAIVNPNRYDDTSKLNYLCAVGVCFVFLVALNKKLRDRNWFKKEKINEPNILNFLDLVSLGTVCDVVPLVDLNRAIVTQGLKVLKKRLNLGLKTLYDLCKIESQPTTYHLGYILGPRINAGGRVGKSSHGAELLISDDPQKTYQIASDLNKSNKERQSIELILSEQVNSQVKNFHDDPVLILTGNNWHEGVIGIVASRIKDKYNKPTILISINESLGKGSARSIFGFNIGKQIIKATQLGILKKGGGHKMAGGFTIKKEKIPLLKYFLIKNFKKSQLNSSKVVDLYLDSVIAPSALNEQFYSEIEKLAPFGSGNSEPKFVIENLQVITSNLIGDKHIKTILYGGDGSAVKTIAFNAKDSPLEPFLNKKNKKRFSIAGKMNLNEWRGKRSVEFIIEDISVQ